MTGKARIAILISGRGSNMQAIIDACHSGAIDAGIACVISNRPGAPGLEKAAAAGITAITIDHREFETREAFDRALAAELRQHEVDLVVLAGFMRILSTAFIDEYLGRLLNIHPSLLPKYPGLNTHQRALDAGDTEAGVTVHFVTLQLDGGPPVIQASVAIEPGDTAQTLAERVMLKEHVIYPLAVDWFITKRLVLEDGQALLDGAVLPAQGLAYRPDMRHCAA
ncbi:MAG: phosphoribosylglycinamide formyltransferase [Gammaproteobacteria bacterium]|nr:phosphoribosylglycinamide formyltransferase [Gammaproteobacteria bacterium]